MRCFAVAAIMGLALAAGVAARAADPSSGTRLVMPDETETPPQSFDPDIVPLAGGQPWQAMRRRVDATLGP